MSNKRKLELTWIGKEARPRLEPRILLTDSTKSYHAPHRMSEADIFDNRLIFGDNLLALKALEEEFAGKVKCVFIDPPYNTGSAFDHFDDGLEHSIWLGLMRDRLQIIERLLSNDGSLWITIDDHEAHYLKVLCDELFGRINFAASFAWEKDQARHNDALISSAHDHILLYAKNISIWKKVRNLQPREESGNNRYKNPDGDPRGPWLQGACSTAKSGSEKNRFLIELPSGRQIRPPAGNYWRFSEETLRAAREENRVYFGKDGDRLPIIKTYLTEVQEGFVPKTWWPANEVGSNQSARRDHLRKLLTQVDPFSTPKPEALIARIIQIASNPGDLVLDSFAGSGTTGAVAHKMGRRWIMVELGEHIHSHIIPRLKKVIDGQDPGGVTELADWKGGGGFRYYRLAPSLLERDKWANWVINRQYDAAMLSAAVCQLESFTYAPSETLWWQHGFSSERDFIYVTTQSLSAEQLHALSEEVGSERTLLVCCAAYRGKADRWPNLTVQKIPKMVLTKCEWGHDDYSLNVANLPMAQPKAEAPEAKQISSSDRGQNVARQTELFVESKP
jgi:adenine-specific DNA-methyltransferase